MGHGVDERVEPDDENRLPTEGSASDSPFP